MAAERSCDGCNGQGCPYCQRTPDDHFDPPTKPRDTTGTP